jgi:hypothetical protein
MSHGNTVWGVLERWNSVPFLVAGGSFSLVAAAYGFGALTGTGIAVSPATIFVCMLVVFVGLLGLYPRLADRDSTLALGGAGLLVLTTAIILSTLGLSVLPIAVSFGKPTIVAIIASVVVGSTLTLTTFGVASLRTGAHPRPVGGFLLVMAVGTSIVVVAMVLSSNPGPWWVGFVVSGLFAISLGSIGYVLRTDVVPADSLKSTDDVAAD